jgi:selenide, water dikinase
LLVGFDLADDAGVVRLDAERALVQTVDFFTPVVDDPWTYGAIAAANSLSDVYAMGGEPLTAMNVLCWNDQLPPEILHDILRGGLDKVREAGVLLVGGHSVTDREVKFGLSVTGLVHPDRIWRNQGALPGDALVLTKPLGTGIVTTALKRDDCPEELATAAITAMLQLNRAARDLARPLDVHACTDITGFGLAGHAWEMARASGVALVFDALAVPLLPGVEALVERKHLTRGERSNREYVGSPLVFDGVRSSLTSVLVDPQTSGGLLLALPAAQAEGLAAVGAVVGRVTEGPAAVVFR